MFIWSQIRHLVFLFLLNWLALLGYVLKLLFLCGALDLTTLGVGSGQQKRGLLSGLLSGVLGRLRGVLRAGARGAGWARRRFRKFGELSGGDSTSVLLLCLICFCRIK